MACSRQRHDARPLRLKPGVRPNSEGRQSDATVVIQSRDEVLVVSPSSPSEPLNEGQSRSWREQLRTSARKIGGQLARGIAWIVGIVICLSVLQQVQPWAQDWWENWVDGDPYLKVWVNPEAKVYYAPGDTAFGNTLPGFYLSQAEARRSGYKSMKSWGWGYGTSARPLKTLTDLASLSDSQLSWTSGSVVLYLHNNSNLEIRELTIWVSEESGPRHTYHLTGQAAPKSQSTWPTSTAEVPSGKKWTWGFVKVRGVTP